jgi:hypothetical protein
MLIPTAVLGGFFISRFKYEYIKMDERKKKPD